MFKVGHPVSISSAEEVIIFLLHFRHYFTPFVLAVFARLTSKVIEGCIQRMRPWFYDKLNHNINMESYDWRVEHGIKFFHDTFTCSIDGSEQPCVSSSKRFTNDRFFSAKKSQASINKLVLVSLTGRIYGCLNLMVDPTPIVK